MSSVLLRPGFEGGVSKVDLDVYFQMTVLFSCAQDEGKSPKKKKKHKKSQDSD